jgi:hypothetical protein
MFNFELRTSEARHIRKSASNGIRRKVGIHNFSWELDEVIGQVLPTHGKPLPFLEEFSS